MKAYKEIDLEQGSPDWLNWRHEHITATSTAKLMGASRWGDAFSVYEAMKGKEVTFVNDAMKRGIELEPVAREHLEKEHGIALEPIVVESTTHPFMGASLDAISKDRTQMFEIKCVGEKTMGKALQGTVDPQYIWQCQKQMFCMGLDRMTLFFYHSKYAYVEIEMELRPNWIKEMIERESDFYHQP